MKANRTGLSRLYHAALKEHLKQGSSTEMEPARELGRHAVAIGLETLDLARIHEIALVSLVLPGYSTSTSDGLLGRAGRFFAEAITPLEENHRGAQEANINLKIMVEMLNQRTGELAESVEGLKKEIVKREAVEATLRASQETSSKLLEKSRQMQDELRHLSRQLLSVQEEERKRISRELHDVIAQTLTGINVRLAALKTESTISTKELQKNIEITQRLVEKSVESIHRFARELRPSVLDDLGLIPALQSFMKDFTKESGVRVSLSAFAGIERLDNIKRTVLYRIAQEALANIAQHAQASRAEVNIRAENGSISMEIKDDGKGFDSDGTSTANQTSRLGLLGMRERVEMIDGTFCVESTPGKHTTIRVKIPSDKSIVGRVRKRKTDNATTLKCP